MTWIYGAGGGGGGKGGGSRSGRTPDVDKDNLESTQYAKVIDLISEGEIEGLVGGAKGVFFENTPLENQDGTFNFKDIEYYERTGTQDQDYIPLGDAVEDETPVGVFFDTEDQNAVRQITDTNVDAVRVTLTIQQLLRIEEDGDQRGGKIEIKIEIQYDGGGYTTVVNDKIKGRTTNPYQRDYLIKFTQTFSTSVDIRVTRLSKSAADKQSDKGYLQYANDFTWTSYTAIIYAKLRYPNSALFAARIDAAQFGSIPNRKYRVRGIKVRIPSNGTVDQNNGRIIYSGDWDGTFAAATWTTDPCWILWDLLTSTRYGFGDQILTASEKANFTGNASRLDKFAFYSASQYSSELVSDGRNGQEPRFSCNVNIQTAEEAYKLINDLCSVFRAMPYWAAGAMEISQDKPKDYSYLFTAANVGPDGFTYRGASRKTRPTVAVVSYLDLDLRDIAYEVVEDQAEMAKWGVVRADLSAFACTSRGQAARIGRWLLYSERYESESVSFTTSIDAGVVLRPGDTIKTSDPLRAGERRGGRIVSATTTTVTVDDSTYLTDQNNAQLNVILPDGTLEQRAVASISDATITVSSAFSAAPNANSVWVLGTSDIQTQTWRVIGVQEQDDGMFGVTAIGYNSSKFDYIENGALLQERDVTNLNKPASAPRAPSFQEVLYEEAKQVLSKLIIGWLASIDEDGRTNAVQYLVQWRRVDGNWAQSYVTTQEYVIYDTTPGDYEVLIYGVNAALRPSAQPARLDVSARGKLAEPANVQNLTIEQISANSARLRWDAATDLDVKIGGRVHIRHTSIADGTGTWTNSQDLIPAVPGYSTEAIVPMVEGEYLVKFEDSSGKQSLAEASVVVDLPDPLSAFLVLDKREDTTDPPFQGEFTNLFYSVEYDAITLGGSALFDTIPDFDLLLDLDYYGDIATTGSYVFNEVLDLGAKYSLDLRRHLVAGGFYPSDLFDERTDLIDTWVDFEGTVADQVNSKVYVRTTDDNPAGSPTWSEYQEFGNGTFTARAFQFKLDASAFTLSQAFACYELGYKASFQRRIENSAVAVQSGAGTKSVTFANPFWTGSAVLGGVNSILPSIGITAQNLQSGDYFNVTNVSSSGFDVTFRNSSGTAVDRLFAWSAVGYGKGS